MARILITSGPTRQYLDPVRYLTNGSSGRMGRSLAIAAVARGHDVVVVSGPVSVSYPDNVEVIDVVSTEEMLAASREEFTRCDGLIGVAAPCDYRPVKVETNKIAKTGDPLMLQLVETPDIVATLGASKGNRWVVGFALETEDHRFRALVKLEKKSCDLMVLNGPEAMESTENSVEVIDSLGGLVRQLSGTKEAVGHGLIELIQQRLIEE